MAINGVVPDSKAFEPTGSADELKALGLDVAVYRCCAKPDPSGGMAGCQFWHICERPYKGLPGPPEGADLEELDPNTYSGPHHHGVLYITAEGKTIQDVRSCYQHAILVNEHQQSGNVYEIVADEGEFIVITGTKAVPVNPHNPGGRQKAAPFMREERVPRFPRPKDVFLDKVYEMRVRDTIAKAQKRRKLERSLGAHADAVMGKAEGTKSVKDVQKDQPNA